VEILDARERGLSSFHAGHPGRHVARGGGTGCHASGSGRLDLRPLREERLARVRGERRREPPLHLAEATLEAAERVAAELLGVEVEVRGREGAGEEDVA